MRRIQSCPQLSSASSVSASAPSQAPRSPRISIGCAFGGGGGGCGNIRSDAIKAVSSDSSLLSLVNQAKTEIMQTLETESVLHVPEIVMAQCRIQYEFPKDLLHAVDNDLEDSESIKDIATCLSIPWEKITDDDPFENVQRQIRTPNLSYIERYADLPNFRERYMNMLRRLRKARAKIS